MTATPRVIAHTSDTPRLFTARYHGQCADCADDIAPDDDVSRNAAQEIVCAPCATASAPKPAYGVCPQCFLARTRNGQCGCF